MPVLLPGVCKDSPHTCVSASIPLPRPLKAEQLIAPCCHLLAFTILEEKEGWHHTRDALSQTPPSEDQTPTSSQPSYSHTHPQELKRSHCPAGGAALELWHTSVAELPIALGLAQIASTTGWGFSCPPTLDTGHGNYLPRVKWVYLDNNNQQRRNRSELERHYKGERYSSHLRKTLPGKSMLHLPQVFCMCKMCPWPSAHIRMCHPICSSYTQGLLQKKRKAAFDRG